MSKEIREYFVHKVPGGGCQYGPKFTKERAEQYSGSSIVVSVDFDPACPEYVRERPRVKCQRDYIEEAIRRFMQTDKFRQGLLAASFGQPIDGAEFAIGMPPSFAALEESYAQMTYGRIEPVRGHVSAETYDAIVDGLKRLLLHSEDNPATGIWFNRALITRDDAVPDGKIRWFYGRL